MKLLKTDRLENPMLIVLTERRGEEETLSINIKAFGLQLDIYTLAGDSFHPFLLHLSVAS